jgi:hypothetical protein
MRRTGHAVAGVVANAQAWSQVGPPHSPAPLDAGPFPARRGEKRIPCSLDTARDVVERLLEDRANIGKSHVVSALGGRLEEARWFFKRKTAPTGICETTTVSKFAEFNHNP